MILGVVVVIAICIVLVIVLVRQRAKNRRDVKGKRQIYLSAKAEAGADGRPEHPEESSELNSLTTGESASCDIPTVVVNSTERPLNDVSPIPMATSAQMLEASNALGTPAAGDPKVASPDSEFVPEEVLTDRQAATPPAVVGPLQEASMIGVLTEPPIGQPPVMHQVQVSSEIIQSQGTETQTLLETTSNGVAVLNITKASVPDDQQVSQTTSANDVDTDDLRTTNDESTAGELASLAGHLQLSDTSEPSADEDKDIEVLGTTSTSQYRAPVISVGPAKRSQKQTVSRHRPSEQLPLLSLVVKGRVQKDFWTFSLLASRPSGAPSDLEVMSGISRVQLIEANDEWYEAPVDSLADWLNGVSFLSIGLHIGNRWQLTRREIHILATDNAVSGWVSTTRLVLGRRHLVLCSEERKNEVATLLKEAGCVDAAQLGEHSGIPNGWVSFWPVTPSRPIAPIAGEELLNLLRPLPDVQVSLEGGLALQSSTWMVGYPPTIRVTGELGEEKIFIDEMVAARAVDGEVRAVGYDIPGQHHISVGGRHSRSYSIIQPELNFDDWIAYDFPMGSLCGALVTPSPAVRFPTKVSSSNPLLIGSEPGQVYLCPTQPGAEWTVFPPFKPVWALPADPLRCRKKYSHITALDVRPPSPAPPRLGDGHRQLWRWINAIRDARRKGLQPKGQSDDAHQLWVTYAEAARDLWRRMR